MAFAFTGCVWEPSDSETSYLALDDSDYPYAGIPRLVIETENFTQIRDRTTEIPARLQVYGQEAPETEILELTVRGRGNSTFTGMPKVGIKLEFANKQALLGMPKDRDWALIPNFADKTHLKNLITYKLACWLGDEYCPRAQFVDVYFNREYLGLYLLSETVKVSKHRVKIPDSDSSFLIEIGPNYKAGKTYFEQDDRLFQICHPKNPPAASYIAITQHVKQWSEYLEKGIFDGPDSLATWLDIEDYIRYYWIQELSKNMDAAFHRSIFFTWNIGEPIKMGPVWDFDVAYGNWKEDSLRTATDWYIRTSGWNQLMFKDKPFQMRAEEYWDKHKDFFETLPDSISKYARAVKPYTANDFKRWPILNSTENWAHKEAYNSYEEAIDSLNSWIKQRIHWISQNVGYRPSGK